MTKTRRDRKLEEYERQMGARKIPETLWEKWERVDGRAVKRLLPAFMAQLEKRTDFHRPGLPENVAQKAAASGEPAPAAPPPVPRLPGRLPLRKPTKAPLGAAG